MPADLLRHLGGFNGGDDVRRAYPQPKPGLIQVKADPEGGAQIASAIDERGSSDGRAAPRLAAPRRGLAVAIANRPAPGFTGGGLPLLQSSTGMPAPRMMGRPPERYPTARSNLPLTVEVMGSLTSLAAALGPDTLHEGPEIDH